MKITILEDEKDVSNLIQSYIKKYFEEMNLSLPIISIFNDGNKLVDEYLKDNIDILFMDIQLPGITGMEAAKKIREKDKNVIIIFVTNLAQYAIKGYEVNAFDFILKPIDYEGFKMKLERILTEYNHSKTNMYIDIKNKEGIIRIPVENLLYLEVISHNIVFHTLDDKYTIRGTLKEYVELLSNNYFWLCNKGYLVNLSKVIKVDKTFVFLSNGSKLIISKGKRKEFLDQLNKYLGGTI